MSWAYHFIFIPAVLGIGFYFGWTLGQRNVKNQWARAEKRRQEEEEAA